MVESKRLATLEWGIREGLSEKVTFKLRPKEQERACEDFWRETIPGGGTR